MESVVKDLSSLRDAFQNQRVLVTGHTGFKGAWLTRWLLALGADVAGFALPFDKAGPSTCCHPPGVYSLFCELGLQSHIQHFQGDICELEPLIAAIADFRPQFVFHLAAQSLVRISYSHPLETFRANILGTIHLLEALRRLNRSVVAIIVTSDKVYENREAITGYREEDRLGGRDPYSCSKAMCELATASYRESFFGNELVKVASARAGNVIGGGDWSIDRIVPDCVRALRDRQPILVRNVRAIRPWQHVLEPLAGYLQLAAAVQREPSQFCTAFNFGPTRSAQQSVGELVQQILHLWPGEVTFPVAALDAPHETQTLTLCAERAEEYLGWSGRWDFAQTIAETISWYQRHSTGQSAESLTMEQIERYQDSPLLKSSSK